jgi:hypothetical protein
VNSAQAKLSTALNNIAYHHVQRYANDLKALGKANAVANAAKAAATANPNNSNVNKAAAANLAAAAAAAAAKQSENNAHEAANLAAAAGGTGGTGAANAALNAEAAFISLIGLQGGNLNINGKLNMNKVKANSRFSNSPNITAAIEKRLAVNRGNNLT